MLVTSNFSFSHIVFKRLVLRARKNKGLFGKGLRDEDSTNSIEKYNISISVQVSGVSCIQNFVSLMKEAEELRKEKVYSLTDIKTKPKK